MATPSLDHLNWMSILKALRRLVAILGVALIVIGIAALVAPGFAAAHYGIDATTSSGLVFVRAAGARDIAIGGILLGLFAFQSETRMLGIAVLIATLVPILDTLSVLQASGLHSPALVLHAGSILPLLILGVALIWARPK